MLIEHALATSWNFSIAQRPIFWVKAAEAAEAYSGFEKWSRFLIGRSSRPIGDGIESSYLKTRLQLEVFHFQDWYWCSNSNWRSNLQLLKWFSTRLSTNQMPLFPTFENPPEWLNFATPKFQKIDDVIRYCWTVVVLSWDRWDCWGAFLGLQYDARY